VEKRVDGLQDFVSGAMQVIGIRKNPMVLILIESEDRGMEFLQSNTSLSWAYGVLMTAIEQYRHMQWHNMTVAASQASQSTGIEIDNAIKSGKGPVN
jgi:hypothetical protein